MIYSNSSNETTFSHGNLGILGLKTSNTSKAIAAIYKDNLFLNGPATSPGIRVYYGGDDGLVHEVTYSLNSRAWLPGFDFPNSNGHAGLVTNFVASNSTPIIHLLMLSPENELRLWYYRLNTTAAPSESVTVYGNWAEGMLHETVSHFSTS